MEADWGGVLLLQGDRIDVSFYAMHVDYVCKPLHTTTYNDLKIPFDMKVLNNVLTRDLNEYVMTKNRGTEF